MNKYDLVYLNYLLKEILVMMNKADWAYLNEMLKESNILNYDQMSNLEGGTTYEINWANDIDHNILSTLTKYGR